MKKILVLFLLLPVLIFSACSFFDVDTSASQERKKIKAMSTEIIRCFSENDKQALGNLFCEQIRNDPDFEQNLNDAFEFFVCDSYWGNREIQTSAGGGKGKEDGKVTHWYVYPQIDYMTTFVYRDDGETVVYTYNINYKWMIYNQDKAKEGLEYLKIDFVNVSSFTLGTNLDT